MDNGKIIAVGKDRMMQRKNPWKYLKPFVALKRWRNWLTLMASEKDVIVIKNSSALKKKWLSTSFKEWVYLYSSGITEVEIAMR